MQSVPLNGNILKAGHFGHIKRTSRKLNNNDYCNVRMHQKSMRETKSTIPKAENFYGNVTKKIAETQQTNAAFINYLVEFGKQHTIPCRLYDDVTHWQPLSFTIKEFG
uniref:Uncharacterized protein n=1 Tax=Glossina austeni TaxID=7395 RepID=A0A1A9VMN6_GLOAU